MARVPITQRILRSYHAPEEALTRRNLVRTIKLVDQENKTRHQHASSGKIMVGWGDIQQSTAKRYVVPVLN
jgi:hypothetical protein